MKRESIWKIALTLCTVAVVGEILSRFYDHPDNIWYALGLVLIWAVFNVI